MYHLLEIFNKISNKYGIRYWAECGTVLGYKRHGGIIPWDDDIDIDVHPDDLSKLLGSGIEKEFSQYGYVLTPIYFGFRVCPISLPVFGKQVKNNTTTNVNYNWPFLDVFATTFFDKTGSGVKDHIRYKDRNAMGFWPDYYLTEEETVLKQVEFGPENMRVKIFVPSNVDSYLNRIYGDNHMTIAYQELDHANNRPIKKVICRVIDRAPGQAALYEIPQLRHIQTALHPQPFA